MANRAAAIKKADAKRLFMAAIEAGFESAKIVIHPDGRIEASGSVNEAATTASAGNSWDDLLR